ncbi:hypothetical protein X777_03758 [Ooceraea biroi]|uniref:DUF8207 domain-containing protein n=1 Tax=Ooceraea biroi TaxID=2015173 RepID=A0A026X2D9_OOCBI|nr:hypothetical protein X777_03758 [Ooceraea biroi]
MVKEIAKTSDSIRKKHRALKTGKMVEDAALERHFRPIIEPLQKLVDNTTDDTSSPLIQTDESMRNTNDTESETLFPQREINVVHNKRKLSLSASPRTSPPKRKQVPLNMTTSTPIEVAPIRGKPGDRESGIDDVYSVYLGQDEMMFGNKRFDVDTRDNIFVDGVRYIGIPGFYELIFMKRSNKAMYTANDMQTYKSMLLTTNTHRRKHIAHGQVKSNKGYKYNRVIAPLLPIVPKKRSGRGLPCDVTLNDNVIDYVHWNDPNELVDRLRLLEASRQAGNNIHDNEILSIIEELRGAGLILIKQYINKTNQSIVCTNMPINKFGVLLERRKAPMNNPYYQFSGVVRNYVRENTLCCHAADFDAQSRKIRRVVQPEADSNAVNKLYVEQYVKMLRNQHAEVERKLSIAFEKDTQALWVAIKELRLLLSTTAASETATNG